MRRILYLGLPLGADILRRSGVSLPIVCIPRKTSAGQRRMRRAPGLVLQNPDLEAPATRELLEAYSPTRIICYFWPRKVPTYLLSMAPTYCTHPSLLPRHRGPAPVFHTILSGDVVTGVTLFRVSAEYDEGNIVAQIQSDVGASENAWALERRLDTPALALLIAAATSARDCVGTPQQGEPSAAPTPTDDELEIRWTGKAMDIARLIRASSPWPGAYTEVHVAGSSTPTQLDIVEAVASDAASRIEKRPGELFTRGRQIFIACGTGSLELKRVRTLQTEHAVSAADFFAATSY